MAIFDLPAGARPGRDTPVGQDELGRMVYRTATGQQYTMPEPPRMAPRAAGPMQGPLAYASPQRMAEMSAYASDLRGMQGSYSPQDIAAAGYSPMEVAAFTTAGRPAVPFSQEADRDRQRAPADVLQEPDYTMRKNVTYMLQDELVKRLGIDEYEAGKYARRVMGDPNAAGILESMGLIDYAALVAGRGAGFAGRAAAAAPAALVGLFNVEEGTQTAQRGYQEGSALQTGLGAVQAVAGMAEMFPASKLIAESIARNVSRMDPNTLYSVFGPPIPPQPVRAPDTGAGSGRPPLTFDEVDRAMQEVPPASAPSTSLDVSRRDASNIFGEGSERVRYTDPQSGGTIEVVVRPDGSASVLELEVPEASRGKGIGQTLQERVMQDFPVMGGQVSSKAAATTAYRLGRRPPGKPNATLEEVFADIDEMSSVNMVSPAMQERLAPAAPSSFRLYQGSPHDFAAERLVRMPDGSTQYIVGSPNVLPDVPPGAEVLRDFPLGRQRMDKIGTGEGAQAYGYGLYGAEAEGVARGYRDALSRDVFYGGSPVASVHPMDNPQAGAIHSVAKAVADGIPAEQAMAFEAGQWRAWAEPYLKAAQDNPQLATEAARRAQSMTDIAAAIEALDPQKFVKNPGRMYELEVNANPEDFLDWDLPLSEQPKKVQEAFRPRIEEFRRLGAQIGNDPDGATLEQIAHPTVQLDDVDWSRGLRQQAADYMREAGIPGIRYLDAGSRGAGDGSRNYVIFDENLINIVRKYGIAGAAAMLGVSAFDVEQALAENMSPSQWDQLVVGPQ